jgi:sensory rhodopsin
MFSALFMTSDVVGTSLAVAALGSLTAGILMALGLSFTSERWRLPIALAAVALFAAGINYWGTAELWLANQKLTSATRFVGWFVIHPLQVAAVYFIANIASPIPPGVFWRTVVAALLMVLSRYLGDAGFFNSTLGVLLSIAFWLYILGEMYFGRMNEAVRQSTRSIRIGYFWIRLIMTIGWALLPLLHFVDVVIGAGHTGSVIALYTIADLVNLIALSVTVLAVAGKERF